MLTVRTGITRKATAATVATVDEGATAVQQHELMMALLQTLREIKK